MRDDRFDFYKGLLMIGVIWGHAINAFNVPMEPSFIHVFLRIWDMPFFMFISGMFLYRSIQKHPLQQLLLNKITMLLCPVMLWSLIRSSGKTCMDYYFIWAVFYSSAIVILLNVLTKKTSVQTILFLLIIISLHCTDYTFQNLAYLFPFFIVGYYTNVITIKPIGGGKRLTVRAMPVYCTVFILLVCFWKTEFSPWNTGFNVLNNLNLLPIVLYRFTIGLLGIYIMRWLFDHFLNTYFKDVICRIGKKTFAIYLFQGILIESALGRVCKMLNAKSDILMIIPDNVRCYVLAPLIAIFTSCVLLYVIGALEKSKWTRWTLGFKVV